MELDFLIPDYYKNNETYIYLQDILSDLSDSLEEYWALQSVQGIPALASLDLARWEKILNLPVGDSLSIGVRRERIMSKLAGSRTTTIQMIKDVAKVFTNGEVEVIEDNSKYHFVVKFISLTGMPPDIEGFRNAIEEIKPAHLSFSFEFMYVTNDSLKRHTHGNLKQFTHERMRNEVIS